VQFCGVGRENVTEVICEHGVIIENYGDVQVATCPATGGGAQLKWYLQKTVTGPSATCRDQEPRRTPDRTAAPLAEFLQETPPIALRKKGRDVLRIVLPATILQPGKRISLN